jgi:peptidoglycan/xylan/chitin deacetylase (PgdA/CDA1 family)
VADKRYSLAVISTLVLVFLFFSVWIVFPYVAKKIQIGRLRQACKAERLIALTYDDGPSVQVTTALLDILRSRNAVATFFLLGHKLDALQEVVARIVSDGHEIGSHSYAHFHAWQRDPVSVFFDIQKGLRAVRAMAACRLFRAPYGKLTLGSMIQVRLQGCRQSWWTIDSTDTWETPRSVEAIINQVRAQGGGVVLLHDLDLSAKTERENFLLDLTRGLLDLAENDGFRICRLGELIYK